MLGWIREHLSSLGLEKSTKFELASDEALVNIIQHAYKDSPGPIEIAIREESPHTIAITIRDFGPPFDPLTHTRSHNKEEAGGLGILFMREYVDEVRYRRKGKCNLLILTRHKRT